MDTAQWPQQGIGVAEKKPRPQKEQALNCPRCSSTNTKFCYYNNYSLSQPRYFCKTCRRYWTNGGALRNVPVGGGSRKNKRSSSSSLSTRKAGVLPDLHQGAAAVHYDGAEMASFPVAEIFRAGNVGAWMTSSGPVCDVSAVYSSAGLGFSGINYGNNINVDINVNVNHHEQGGVEDHHHHHHANANSSRVLFPFEELKPVHHNGDFEERESGNHGYWSGMINGGSSW